MNKLLAALAMMMLPLAAPAATLTEAKVGFTADRTLVIDGHVYQGKIWATPGKERHEQAIKGFQPVFLLDRESPIGEIVLANVKTIVQFVIPPPLRVLGHDLKKNPLGEDRINGVETTKYEIDETVQEGHAAGTLWLSRDGIPMKLVGSFVAPQGKTTAVRWELSRVKIGPQPAALFEPPKGYSTLPAEALAPLLGLKLKSAGLR